MQKYSPNQIEQKWQEIWKRSGINAAKDLDVGNPSTNAQSKKYYCLDMFPYPSGSGLHVGHWRGYVLSDVAARIKKAQGYNVLHPMGWDAFGLPAENYALKMGVHPRISTDENIKAIKRQLMQMGTCIDWSREIDTTDPEYYKYTQWIFLQMYERGLAYRTDMEINWCPQDKTGLANEEVIDGKCERCGTSVEKKKIPQWVLKITAYADRLLTDLDQLDWPEKVKTMQRNWIGKSEGLQFSAHVKDSDLIIETYSAHFEAFVADTFVVIAPDHPLLPELIRDIQNKQEIMGFCEEILAERIKSREEREPTGIFTGKYLTDVINGGELPIWVASYALADYGTGIVKCSAHDERDFAFAKKYNIPLRAVLLPEDPELRAKVESFDICYTDMQQGILSAPAEFAGKKAGSVRQEIIEHCEQKGYARRTTNYKLRDWIFSRQRYWGEPIPLVYCQHCAASPANEGEKQNPGWIPVPESELPLRLPDVEKYEPTGTGESPLAGIPEFVNTTCPRCGGPAKRETNTMPQWAGSCWYYMAYAIKDAAKPQSPSLLNDEVKRSLKKWLPVDLYVGGVEHAVLHLLYARFWHKVLFDIGVVDHPEPFKHLFNQGMVTLSGAKMSKSKGNVVSPDEMIEKYGTDALRAYELFIAPPEQDAEWNTNGLSGVARFLSKVWDLATEVIAARTDSSKNLIDGVIAHNNPGRFLDLSIEIPEAALQVKMHQTIKKYNEAIADFRYNTLVSTLMEYTNFLIENKSTLKDYPQPLILLIQLLSPICPHIAEELWVRLGFESSLFSGIYDWPEHNDRYLIGDMTTVTIQENGKFRGTIEVVTDSDQAAVEASIKETRFASLLEGYKKIIYVPNKIINVVR